MCYPCTEEWGGVRISNYCRCALLEIILLFIYFFSWNVTISVSIFCSGFLCQTALHCGSIVKKKQKYILANLLINVFLQNLSRCFVTIFKKSFKWYCQSGFVSMLLRSWLQHSLCSSRARIKAECASIVIRHGTSEGMQGGHDLKLYNMHHSIFSV